LLVLTEAAGRHLSRMLQGESTRVIRLTPHDQFLTPRLDEIRHDDVTFEYSGRVVLALEPSVAVALSGFRLDSQITDRGADLGRGAHLQLVQGSSRASHPEEQLA